MKSWLQSRFSQIKIVDIFLFLLAVSLSVNLVSLYISSERFFYYWDIGGYQGVAINVANEASNSIRAALASIRESLSYDYNYYFTIPLIPLILLFGKTRLSFVMSVTLLYQMPYALVIGAISTKIISLPRRGVFWSVVFLTLLMPIAWAATLQAYPDVVAALFIALAILFYVQNEKLKYWWQLILIGVTLGAAMLLRRPFAYDVIAFFAAMALSGFFIFSKPTCIKDTQTWRGVLGYWGRIGLVLVVTIATLLIFGKPFFIRAITTNFNALYTSYAMDPSRMLRFFISIYGWITWILVGLGFSIGIIKKVLKPTLAGFILLFGLFSFIAWIIIVRMIAITFPLHTAIIIILGMASLLWVIQDILKGKLRTMAMAGIAIFFITNLVIGLTPTNLNTGLRQFFSQSNPPFKRAD
jgi:hypothetical protein